MKKLVKWYSVACVVYVTFALVMGFAGCVHVAKRRLHHAADRLVELTIP